jgi:DNA-binding beta-propeller fold protein YncE
VIPSTNTIVVAEAFNHRIRLVTYPGGVVTTLAGSGIGEGTTTGAFADGTGTAASFNEPKGVAVIPSSGVIVVADFRNHRIRLVTPLGVVTTLAGSNIAFADGTGTGASFIFPQGVAVDPFTDRVYVADTFNQRIRQVTLPYS